MTKEEYLKEKKFIVYMHIFPNNKKYIGITSKKPKQRWESGTGYRTQRLMYRAIKKYKWENIDHKILYTNLSKKEAEQKEIELIAYHKTNDSKYGYNIENGGNSIGKHNKSTRLKISIANKGKKNPKVAKANKGNKYCVGRIVSEETKKKISVANKGKHYSPKTEFRKGYSNIKWRKKVLCIDTNILYESITSAFEDTNISIPCISICCSGKTKTAGGYHWRYHEE